MLIARSCFKLRTYRVEQDESEFTEEYSSDKTSDYERRDLRFRSRLRDLPHTSNGHSFKETESALDQPKRQVPLEKGIKLQAGSALIYSLNI